MWQQIKNIYHLARAILATLYYGFPSKKLTVIGVTGTDGKTTTSHMVYEILKAAGVKISLISSVHAAIGDQSYDTGFHVTTPDPFALQKFLKLIVDNKSKYVVLEVTSHGLDQNRTFGINFTIGVITNITHEHLDYHKTYQNYVQAKAKLFKKVKYSLLNADDDSFNLLKTKASGKIFTYGLKSKSSDFNLKNFPIGLNILGQYNFYNALAAAAVASIIGIPKKNILASLKKFRGVSGRMEEVKLEQNFKVIVDFAHTPNALEQALKTLRSLLTVHGSRLIAVFGAAGERDRTKRPLMGQVAAKYADVTVLTAEDPRTEKVEEICQQVVQGLVKEGKKEGKDFFKVYDRTKAIQLAIDMAQKGDIVATFGKSHEKSMCYGKKEYPWDEFAQVKKAIKRRLAHGQK